MVILGQLAFLQCKVCLFPLPYAQQFFQSHLPANVGGDQVRFGQNHQAPIAADQKSFVFKKCLFRGLQSGRLKRRRRRRLQGLVADHHRGRQFHVRLPELAIRAQLLIILQHGI